ncbi:MAG: hypothetical protein V7K25_14675 [Nostoc sp.]
MIQPVILEKLEEPLPVLTREKIESAEAVFFSIASLWENVLC